MEAPSLDDFNDLKDRVKKLEEQLGKQLQQLMQFCGTPHKYRVRFTEFDNLEDAKKYAKDYVIEMKSSGYGNVAHPEIETIYYLD